MRNADAQNHVSGELPLYIRANLVSSLSQKDVPKMAENLAADSRLLQKRCRAMEGRWLCLVKSYSRRTQIVLREAAQHPRQQEGHGGEQWRIDSE